MNESFSFASFFDAAKQTHEYWAERAFLDFTENIIEQMTRDKVSRAELARRLGTSTPYVTKILKGDTNFTLDTMVKVALALGCELKTHLQPEGAKSQWFDVLQNPVRPVVVFQNTQEMRHEFSHYKTRKPTESEELCDDSLAIAS